MPKFELTISRVSRVYVEAESAEELEEQIAAWEDDGYAELTDGDGDIAFYGNEEVDISMDELSPLNQRKVNFEFKRDFAGGMQLLLKLDGIKELTNA